MRHRLAIGALAWTCLAACSDANLAEPEGLGLAAARYVELAVDLMRAHSIKRNEIDWETFRAETLEDAGNARTTADTYDAIRAAVERLGDGHSSFQVPSPATLNAVSAVSVSRVSAPAPARVDPSAEQMGAGTAYLAVPAFTPGGPAATDHADLYHDLLEAVDTLGVCRWVVDLRGNTGGNMWPMLAGVGPLLGAGPYGYFIDPDSVVNEWTYEDGGAGLDGAAFVQASDPYTLTVPEPPVAVLTDSLTASAAEAIAIAFRERPQTRSFGGATFGVPTAVAPYGMPDRAVLLLAVAWTADRTGTIYEDPLVPDSTVEGETTGERASDAALDAAVTWLEGFPCS